MRPARSVGGRRPHLSRRRWPLIALGLVPALLVTHASTASATAASRAGSATSGPGTAPPVSHTFECGAALGTLTVPQDSPGYSMEISATGGSGGKSEQSPGGRGGHVSGSLHVGPGDDLTVASGCAGANGLGVPESYCDGFASRTRPGGPGGASPYGAGGAPGAGGCGPWFGHEGAFASDTGSGGGGASAVMLGGRTLVVAGGGGGAGGDAFIPGFPPPPAPGTPGGAGGNPPNSAHDCPRYNGDGESSTGEVLCFGGQGRAASSTAGEDATSPQPCRGNSPAQGGAGGGGGGSRGGSAGSWPTCANRVQWDGPSMGAGGGGGLSFIDPSVSNPLFGTAATPGNGSVTLTLTPTGGLAPVALSSSPASPVVGNQATFTATLTGVAGFPAPTGTVQFTLDETTPLGSPAVGASGAATSAPTPHLFFGSHTMRVVYSGDSTYLGSTQTVPFEVGPAPPAISLSLQPDPAVDGKGVAVTATVHPAWEGGPVPGGQVQFVLDGAPVGCTTLGDCNIALDATGAATSGVSEPLAYGPHTVVVNYLGDTSYTAASATTTTFARDESFVSLQPSYSIVGPTWLQTLTFTTTVAGTGGVTDVPTGTVALSLQGGGPLIAYDTQAPLGPVALVAGVATTPRIDQSKLGDGLRTVVAVYSGESRFQPGQASTVLRVCADLTTLCGNIGSPPGGTPPNGPLPGGPLPADCAPVIVTAIGRVEAAYTVAGAVTVALSEHLRPPALARIQSSFETAVAQLRPRCG